MSKNISLPPVFGWLAGGASAVIIIAGLKLAASVVNMVLISFLLAFSISPIQNWLIKRKVSKSLAVIITILIVLVGGSGLVSILAVSVASLIGKLPDYEIDLAMLWKSVNAFFTARGIDVSGLLTLKEFDPSQMVGVAGKLLGAVLQGMSKSLFVVIIMVFVLIELAAVQFRDFRSETARTGFQDRIFQTVEDVAKYIAITGWNGLINAAANYLWLLILGIDFALTWAVVSFFFNFIPNIGIAMAIIPPTVIALLEYGWLRALLVVAGYVLLNFIAENVIKPRTMKARLDISPLLTILSVIFWGWVLGPPGAILAVPLTITLQKLWKEETARQEGT